MSSGGSQHQLLTRSLSKDEHVGWQGVAGLTPFNLSSQDKWTSEVYLTAFNVSRPSTQSHISCLILSFSDMLSHTFAFPNNHGSIKLKSWHHSVFCWVFSCSLMFLENPLVDFIFFFLFFFFFFLLEFTLKPKTKKTRRKMKFGQSWQRSFNTTITQIQSFRLEATVTSLQVNIHCVNILLFPILQIYYL